MKTRKVTGGFTVRNGYIQTGISAFPAAVTAFSTMDISS